MMKMPELPEVEVTRLSFVDRIVGAKILDVFVGKPLRWPLSRSKQALVGETVLGVRRRGKYLLLDLSHGLLLIHLGMSGSLRFEKSLHARGAHDHFELISDQGVLRLHDPRRFGAVVYGSSQATGLPHKLLAHLGVEPLGEGFDALDFYEALRLKRSSIKAVLLAGEVVVGVGNIYASEALFLAGIRPSARANALSKARVKRLRDAIVQVLERAVQLGGSSLRDFSNAQGQVGYFQLQTWVYARQGQACRVCETPIKGLRQAQRSSFYCPTCQKR
jgi:formamidopyrimidine-DNA glycosylase